ncbi:MAG: SPOR domain-containing protein [Hyphomicrobium sp.]|uniref:SPOR domain-containing protein n=1 Tax=Hyphomicrobium sp. TaxID=82 RepID=UPI0039E3BB1A
MSKPAADRPMRRKTNASSQTAIWAVLGAVGLGYLGVAFFAPAMLPDLSGGHQHASDAKVLEVAANVETLKMSLTQLQSEVSSIHGQVTDQATQTQQLSSQLTALDDKVRLAQGPTTTTTASAEPQAAPAGSDGAPMDGTDAGPAPAKIINASPAPGAPIETGSVDKPISFGPAVVKPAPKIFGLQLATDPSIDGLRVTWGALSQIHSQQLSHLKARYADLGTATSPSFGLIAGPVKSKAEARKLCKELAAQSITCKVSEYRGADL